MRIAELSHRTGVPVPTIKYYLREGLLPPGERTGPNQARYDERHVRRLRLVRALVDVGRVPIATIRELLADADRPDPDLHHMLGRALKPSLTGAPAPAEAVSAATEETDALIARRGWRVGPDTPAREALAEVIAALRHLDAGDLLAGLDEYAEAAERIAEIDLRMVSRLREPGAVVYHAVVGTILGDTLLAALRRLAQEDASSRTFRVP